MNDGELVNAMVDAMYATGHGDHNRASPQTWMRAALAVVRVHDAADGPTLTERALKADRDSRAAYARGREEERRDCISDVRAEAAPCGCAMRIEARIVRGDAP